MALTPQPHSTCVCGLTSSRARPCDWLFCLLIFRSTSCCGSSRVRRLRTHVVLQCTCICVWSGIRAASTFGLSEINTRVHCWWARDRAQGLVHTRHLAAMAALPLHPRAHSASLCHGSPAPSPSCTCLHLFSLFFGGGYTPRNVIVSAFSFPQISLFETFFKK